eukprot:NODE_133_length_16612_cov_1.402531.p7 type:complete len:162 gc:universal NODE_133_length_16612_cov_1.402531:9452-9937(+)
MNMPLMKVWHERKSRYHKEIKSTINCSIRELEAVYDHTFRCTSKRQKRSNRHIQNACTFKGRVVFINLVAITGWWKSKGSSKTLRPRCMYKDCRNKVNTASNKCHVALCGKHFNVWHWEYKCYTTFQEINYKFYLVVTTFKVIQRFLKGKTKICHLFDPDF